MKPIKEEIVYSIYRLKNRNSYFTLYLSPRNNINQQNYASIAISKITLASKHS